jgi:1-aminocyclopropane-1-carboxylate deaminase/D-cysteine desulfhydrase-like pyridoxal-dependent ACC family enzyme
MQADFKIDDVMTGDGKKKIGEYGYVEITKEQLESITMEEYDVILPNYDGTYTYYENED